MLILFGLHSYGWCSFADPPVPIAEDSVAQLRKVPVTMLVAVVLVVGALFPAIAVPGRIEVLPDRASFAAFPLRIDDWEGRSEILERIYVDALKFTDYSLIN